MKTKKMYEQAERLEVYVSPAVEISRIELEGLIAATATPDIEFASGVDPQNIKWTNDQTIGGGDGRVEGGDLLFSTW
ncbi:MAG: hypothetical protein LBB64_04595 [Dysgonamonadaceae bacterium]|jgi:hypothetical protein|nr:hypothetical protein [Dysgonamonadaceae bacterium]